MGCAFVKLCPEWSGYKGAGHKLAAPPLESSPLLNDENKKKATPNTHLYQVSHCLLGEATQADDKDAIEQSAETNGLLEPEQTPQLSTKSAENIDDSLDSDNISVKNIQSLSSSLTSDCPNTSQADRPPDILDNTVATGCSDDAIFHEHISTQETGPPAASTAGNCHLPDFQIEHVLKEYQAMVEECAILRTRVQAIEAEIEIERTRKSEELDNLQTQFAEVASEFQFLKNKSNLMLLASGIPLLVLVFAVLLVIYPVLGAVTSKTV